MGLKISFNGVESYTECLTQKYFSEEFIQEKQKKLEKTVNDPAIGFFHLANKKELLNSCKEAHTKFSSKKTFVHIGIGGSSLGPEMLISALAKDNDQKFIFINNIDPDHITSQLKNIDISDSLFYIVSKSGGTAETMSGFAIASNILAAKGISKKDYKDYFIFATDPKSSQLLELGKELEITCLNIPSNIGGRFSVLSPVGLFPALFAGIDADMLLKGAASKMDCITSKELYEMASYLFGLSEKGVNQTVFMPYSSKLRGFSFWFIQLWAESLGKKDGLNDKSIHTGLTPIPGYGATDQHSQIQLFMEGPYDKCLLLLEVDKFDHDFSLKTDFSQASLQQLKSHSLAELMKAELNGTLMALKESNRPHIRLTIPKNDEFSMGELILFFETLTALMGHYLVIDPFNQPGVEAGKKFAFEWLTAQKK